MALTFQPFGFSLYSYEGGKTSFTSRTFPLSPTGMTRNLGFGDSVSFSSGTPTAQGLDCMLNTNNTTFNAGIAAAYTIGIIESFQYTTPQGEIVNTTYWAANTPTKNAIAPIVTVNHLPNCIFRIQANAAFSANGAYGMNCNMTNNGATAAYAPPSSASATVTQPNPATGQSNQFLVSTGSGQNAYAGQCKILGLSPTSTALPINNWTDPFPVVLVRFNMHYLSAATPSIA